MTNHEDTNNEELISALNLLLELKQEIYSSHLESSNAFKDNNTFLEEQMEILRPLIISDKARKIEDEICELVSLEAMMNAKMKKYCVYSGLGGAKGDDELIEYLKTGDALFHLLVKEKKPYEKLETLLGNSKTTFLDIVRRVRDLKPDINGIYLLAEKIKDGDKATLETILEQEPQRILDLAAYIKKDDPSLDLGTVLSFFEPPKAAEPKRENEEPSSTTKTRKLGENIIHLIKEGVGSEEQFQKMNEKLFNILSDGGAVLLLRILTDKKLSIDELLLLDSSQIDIFKNEFGASDDEFYGDALSVDAESKSNISFYSEASKEEAPASQLKYIFKKINSDGIAAIKEKMGGLIGLLTMSPEDKSILYKLIESTPANNLQECIRDKFVEQLEVILEEGLVKSLSSTTNNGETPNSSKPQNNPLESAEDNLSGMNEESINKIIKAMNKVIKALENKNTSHARPNVKLTAKINDLKTLRANFKTTPVISSAMDFYEKARKHRNSNAIYRFFGVKTASEKIFEKQIDDKDLMGEIKTPKK